jgi:hypothetical protein
MSDIRQDISAACVDLDAVTDALAPMEAQGSLPARSYEFFKQVRNHSIQLGEIRNLIEARETALAALKSFPGQKNPDNPATFLYNGIPVPFWQGRLLLLQSYMGTCWAAYDTISKVAGVLICTDKSAKNLAKPIKLQEDLLSLPNAVGAHLQEHLKGAYGWPIGISYAIRNWVLHDGNSQDGIDLFRYSTPETGAFQLSEDGWSKIVERCTNRYKVDETLTRLDPFPSVRDDLVSGLSACHAEVDEAICFVLLAATGGIKLQAQILFRRDS